MRSEATLGGVATRAARTARRHWRALLVVALAIFVPLGLIEAVNEAIDEVDFDEIGDAEAWTLLAAALMAGFTALLGEIFFAGVVAAAVSETHGGEAPTLGELVRSIPFATLLAIDVLTAFGVAFGVILFVVPGILFLGWFGLAAPLAKIEHLRTFAAFRRSRRLARGHLLLILLVLLPVALGGQLLSAALGEGIAELIGESFGAHWLAASVSEIIATPLWALAAVAMTFELLEAEAGRAKPS